MRRLKVAADSRDPVNLERPDPLSDDLERATSRLQDRAESMRAWLLRSPTPGMTPPMTTGHDLYAAWRYGAVR